MNAENPDLWFSDAIATFGDRLAAAREAAGLTEAAAAAALGVAPATYDGWEKDAAMPRANQVHILSGILGVSLTWLLTGEGPGLSGPDDAHAEAAIARLTEDLAETQARMQLLEARVRQMMMRLE
ncbi:helix-turn-helix domain-containing protein [Cereibacter azotoformans]|uniref:helix-turn-helix domain-containing protein n=1 Tax=Cereibacter azotoformans TaxID=43057 RepID=UPI000C6DEABE|nr:helix-turn-helix domain-containing protein [Cereibacter azotoformans]